MYFLICKKVASYMVYSKIHYRLINNLSERDKLTKLVENVVKYFFSDFRKGKYFSCIITNVELSREIYVVVILYQFWIKAINKLI